ncbi:flagellar biosynthesis protein FlhA [Burkholderia ubonensis]|uniref:flagellar biosynthesis protein FlhA n=1 Tax=Burkholderia ubonensis TaxID=101571 RepID=UPI00075F4D25|nr:flagellar biosynthesis protein FlhA [Burkholderia ubonensis]KWB79398.1 flagellar biosynthesis protein FlhA [Burkholderia ubonensis]
MKSLLKKLTDLRGHRLASPILLFAVLAMVILPLPPFVLDVLFTFNIVLGIVVLLVSVTVRRPLEFSAFPTIILASTLMRLTLGVATARIVLLNGHLGTHAAGHVIESFGKVVIGGNFVVGLVVFVILMIINFVVVTKGSERISEVSARFTLDAMPGKQMAIDADLNAGLINQERAQTRRREVAMEADFYGAMDGASKFVRGDAVASMLVLVINLIGGLAIGALIHGMSASDAFHTYSLLTIGDGLAAQIPALLLSAAAAIIVTRVNDDGDLERQIGSQMLASPNVLFGAAALMFVLAIIPGMPWLPFLAFASVLAFAGWRVTGQAPREEDKVELEKIEAALFSANHEPVNWDHIGYVDPLAVSFGVQLLPLIDKSKGAPLARRLDGLRRSMSNTFGFLLPAVTIRDDRGLKPTQYAIAVNGTELVRAHVHPDKLMAIPSPEIYGQINGTPEVDPAYGMLVTWITPKDKTHAIGLGYQVVECTAVIATHVAKVIRENLPDLLRHDDVGALMQRLAAVAPKLADALDKAMTCNQIRKVLRVLLTEQVSLKNVDTIATTLLEASDTMKDPVLLAAEVRCALRREIVADVVGARTNLPAFGLSSELEGLLLGSLHQAQQAGPVNLENFAIDPNLLAQLQTRMPDAREQMKLSGLKPVLLVIPQLRPLLARYARLFAPGLSVLSYNEVPEGWDVDIQGTIG